MGRHSISPNSPSKCSSDQEWVNLVFVTREHLSHLELPHGDVLAPVAGQSLHFLGSTKFWISSEPGPGPIRVFPNRITRDFATLQILKGRFRSKILAWQNLAQFYAEKLFIELSPVGNSVQKRKITDLLRLN